MREIVIAAVALVVGLLIGGYAPRGELRALKTQVAELEARPSADRRLGREMAAALAGRPSIAPSTRVDPPPAGFDPEPPPAEDSGGADVEPYEPAEPVHAGDEPFGELHLMRDAMELRRTQARAALLEGANPTRGQLGEIDAALAEMNDALDALADELVGTLASGHEPGRREMMGFAADTLDAVIAADDRMWSALTAEQRDALQEGALDPFSYVDPRIVDRLSELDR